MFYPLQNIVDSFHERSGIPFAVVLPDGSRFCSGRDHPAFSLIFHSDLAVLSVIARGHMGLLESYFDQSVDVDGNLQAAFAAGLLGGLDMRGKTLHKLENGILELHQSNHSAAQAKENAGAHYGMGADFYRLWLDDVLMMYTCAYWPEGTQTLEQAQEQKVDHICRKLRLSRGESFVDVGCGFGGFLFRAWDRLGALGTGLNTTTEQVRWVNQEIQRRGLADKLQVREGDFRSVDCQYDKLVSIGVLEHAGRDQLDAVIRAHAEFLKPGGLGLLHFIGHIGPRETDLFIRKHVFPGGWIPALSDVIICMERHGLEVIDIENLRRHYALTLDVWAHRFEQNWKAIHALNPQRFDERFRRIWRAYLIGCAEMFRSPSGYTHLFQIVFSKGNVSRTSYPMGRGHLYGV